MKALSKCIILCLALSLCFVACGKKGLEYPVTKKVDHVDDYHGTKVADPYRWLEDMNHKDTATWVEAQNKVTHDYLKTIPFRDKLKARYTELWNYEKYYRPVKRGNYYFYAKNDGLQEHNIYYYQEGPDGEPKVLLDPNTFSKDGTVSLAGMVFSKDLKYLAYGVSRGGSDWTEYYVVEFPSLKKLDDHIQWIKFNYPSWYKDGFFYSRYAEPKKDEKLKAANTNQKLYYHKLGAPQAEDKLVYEEPQNPRRGFESWTSRDQKHMMIKVWEGSASSDLLYYKNLEKDTPVTPIVGEDLAHFEIIGVYKDQLMIHTDYQAPNYQLILIDPEKKEKENWKTLIPESKYKIEDVDYVGGKLIVAYLKDVTSQASVFDLEGKKLHDIELPGIGTASGFSGDPEVTEVFYSFTSFNFPRTVYRYTIAENKSEVFRKPKIKFDPEKYVTRQVFYESKDKTKVPLFIVHKKDIELDGQHTAVLYAYGGFNVSMKPGFRLSILPLLENGGVYALACLRGGGEYGEKWHKAGMLEKRQNVFDDYIAAAEYLIKEKYTSPERLAIHGGSNGGLLVGAVMNQRPDLFKVAIPQVGVMDMLRYHKWTIGWAWTPEYGSADNPEHFKFLLAYSPVHNLKKGVNYPATLVTTADHDDRVFPAHSFKYIATLQEKHQGPNPVLVRIETQTGHSAGTATSKTIEEYTDIYSFIFFNTGVTPTL